MITKTNNTCDQCFLFMWTDSLSIHSIMLPVRRGLSIQLFRKMPLFLQQMTQLLQQIDNFTFFHNQIQSPLTFSGTAKWEQEWEKKPLIQTFVLNCLANLKKVQWTVEDKWQCKTNKQTKKTSKKYIYYLVVLQQSRHNIYSFMISLLAQHFIHNFLSQVDGMIPRWCSLFANVSALSTS